MRLYVGLRKGLENSTGRKRKKLNVDVAEYLHMLVVDV